MKPRELIALLELEHPEQEVVLMAVKRQRLMQILGINAAKSAELGAIVLDVDWSAENKVEETKIDKLERQRARLTKEIERLTDEAKEELARSIRVRSKSDMTEENRMIDEILGPMKKGRKKKKSTAKRGRGRPRKYKKPEEMAQEKEE